MRSLIVDVKGFPEPISTLPDTSLSAFPQILLEGIQLWRRVEADTGLELIGSIKDYQPAVVVFAGPQAEAVAWSGFCEKAFPRLFAMPQAPAADEDLLDVVFARTRELRRRRLADRPVANAADMKQAMGQTDPAQLMGAIFPEATRLQARMLGARIIAEYDLQPLFTQMDAEAFDRGLSLLALLILNLGDAPPRPRELPLLALDVGCHLWSYAPFLRAYLARFGQLALTGLEIDPWFLQADGYTRADWARYWARLAEADFREGPLLRQTLPQQDLITLLMPLILPENALRWGLPRTEHQPEALLANMRLLLKPGGRALIYTGVEAEHLATVALLEGLKWYPLFQGPYNCPLRQQPHGFVIRLGN